MVRASSMLGVTSSARDPHKPSQKFLDSSSLSGRWKVDSGGTQRENLPEQSDSES